MPLDPRARRFLDVLAASNPLNALDLPIAQRREGLAQLLGLSGPPVDMASVESLTLPAGERQIPARLYVPREATGTPSAGLIYVHGGGLVAGNLDTHDAIARGLAAAAACRVIAIDYRVAPEHPYPAGLDDTLAAIRACQGRASALGIDPARLGICGESAGGTLSAAACHALAAAGTTGLRIQVLLCPILDYGGTSASRQEFARGYLVEEATLQDDLRHCLTAGFAATDERISPLRARDLSGVPPTIIHTAEYDPLRDEARAYYERLERTGSALSYTCHPGMVHLFYGLAGAIPQARAHLAAIGTGIRTALG